MITKSFSIEAEERKTTVSIVEVRNTSSKPFFNFGTLVVIEEIENYYAALGAAREYSKSRKELVYVMDNGRIDAAFLDGKRFFVSDIRRGLKGRR